MKHTGRAAVALAVLVGSRGLRDYDLALLPYTLGVLLAAFMVAYRYTVWLQRPSTSLYLHRGAELVFAKGRAAQSLRSLFLLVRAGFDGFVAQRFISHRSPLRWVAHFCLAWGCVLAAAVTFPLVFGWIHFETRIDDLHWYRVVVFGQVVQEFHTESLTRYVMFNLLNVSAVLVTVGAFLALRRRLKDREAEARQQFGHDILPLLLLLSISVTGLMLTFSMHALAGYGYGVISAAHAICVTGTLLYMPFGKLFHVFQRPAQLAVVLYRDANAAGPSAVCARCQKPYAGALHVQDLKGVLDRVGLDFRLPGSGTSHFSDVCPACRRRLLGALQGPLLEH